MENKPKVIIYCDGACFYNPGPGGYAALLISEASGNERVVSGYEKSTTNNKMELKAAVEGLKALKKKCKVVLFSDSNYLVKGMNEWLKQWKKKNFKNANNKEIKNVELWKSLDELNKKHDISWRWIKGHSGHELNDRVDEIAKEQAALAAHYNQ